MLRCHIIVLLGLITGEGWCNGFRSPAPVRTAQGWVRGTIMRSRDGLDFAAYLGIPYAAPPVGDLRFKAPIPHEAWTGVRKATRVPPMCVQDSPGQQDQVIGQEDCLYLNVYSPKQNRSDRLPVIVWFPGGGFREGSASPLSYGPEYFMDHSVVLVSVQYRLGVFGFISFQSEQIPGNFGLKDQVLALQWVKQNIRHFRGDPASVTIYGESAGATAVNLHLVSPLSQGLFHRAILQSGASVSPKFLLPQTVAADRSNQLATRVGCPKKAGEDLLGCLQKVPVLTFVEAVDKYFPFEEIPTGSFLPTVEPPSTPLSFLPRHPLTLNDSGVPVIMGVTFDEGATTVAPFCTDNFQRAALINAAPDFWLPRLVSYDYLRPEAKVEVTRKLAAYYLRDLPVGEDNFAGLVDMVSDLVIVQPAVESALHHATNGPVYFYLFNYQLSGLPSECSRQSLGVGHGEDLLLFFRRQQFNVTLSAEDVMASNRVLHLWTSFARNGVPDDASWSPTTTPDIDYLYITNQGFTQQQGLFTKRVDFVNALVSNNIPGH